MDYHKRVDFRAMDVFVDAVANASPEELATALADAKEWSTYAAVSTPRRRIWRELARLLRAAS